MTELEKLSATQLRKVYNKVYGKSTNKSKKEVIKSLKKHKTIRKKYLKGLKGKDLEKQISNIKTARKMYKQGVYVNRPKLKSFKSKKSKHIINAEKMYGITNMSDLATISKKTGCSVASLKGIIKKGEGAYYSDGSRPNQTGRSWGLARLASTITGGKAAKVDYHLLKEGKCSTKVMKLAEKYRFDNGKSKIELLSIKKSNREGKKYMARFKIIKNGKTTHKTTHFGAKGMSDFTIHKDRERRSRYITRHKKDLRTKDPTRAGYLSMFVLWGNLPNFNKSVQDYKIRLQTYNRTGKFPEKIV